MMRRKNSHGGGGHGAAWVVSFADLMALLMAFFVMLLSFSVQEQDKLEQAAGSVRDAFGITRSTELAGVIELNGNPARDFLKATTDQSTDALTAFSTDDSQNINGLGQGSHNDTAEPTTAKRALMFALGAASLKQAWQDQPDITALADNLLVESSEDGIHIVIADRSGRAMFPEGSKYPFEITRKAIAAMAPALAKLPNQIRISGHTAAGTIYENPRYGAWELSFDRANAVR
ncbi:MAG TPA: flagellar motor protein MotB, partial [Devosia sp.]|nr:flagellar motor protein MotB [Devosia sp.]